jgi:hypothetical protein
MTQHFEWQGDTYNRVRADGVSLYIAGWVGPLGPNKTNPQLNWYARTAGKDGVPTVRAEFETNEEARAFIQMMCNMEASCP